jgi:FtsH-binding integral membrane protein
VSFQTNPQGTGYGQPAPGTIAPATAAVQGAFLTQAFFWMFAGLLLTAGISTVVASNDGLINAVARQWFIFLIVQLGLGIGIQALLPRMSATLGLGLFFGFAATMGLTVGVIVSLYRVESVITAFLGASAMFGAAALYGATTKRNLNSIGGFLFMGMVGVFVASIVNLWLHSSTAGLIVSVIGVIVFTVYTAYDVQKIGYGDYAASLGSVEKASVLGAIHLYINFVNIFLFLLRLMGSRR